MNRTRVELIHSVFQLLVALLLYHLVGVLADVTVANVQAGKSIYWPALGIAAGLVGLSGIGRRL